MYTCAWDTAQSAGSGVAPECLYLQTTMLSFLGWPAPSTTPSAQDAHLRQISCEESGVGQAHILHYAIKKVQRWQFVGWRTLQVYYTAGSSARNATSSEEILWEQRKRLTVVILFSTASEIPAAACLFSLASMVRVLMITFELIVRSCSSTTYWLTNSAKGSAITRGKACRTAATRQLSAGK